MTALRDVVDAILYIGSTGCPWAMLANDFPPPSTVQRYFYDWRSNGLLERINHHLIVAAREAEGRETDPRRRRERQPERENHAKRRCSGP